MFSNEVSQMPKVIMPVAVPGDFNSHRAASLGKLSRVELDVGTGTSISSRNAVARVLTSDVGSHGKMGWNRLIGGWWNLAQRFCDSIRKCIQGGLVCLTIGFLAGCTTPIGTSPTTSKAAYAEATRSALNSNRYGEFTRLVLVRYSLEDEFSRNPRESLQVLAARAENETRRDVFFALAELQFLQGERLRCSQLSGATEDSRNAFLSAAVYAYRFLFSPGQEPRPSSYDQRFNQAVALYNYGLANGLSAAGAAGAALAVKDEGRHLAGQDWNLRVDFKDFPVEQHSIHQILAADLLSVHGLAVHDQTPGIGAPLVVVLSTNRQAGSPAQMPASALLRLPDTNGCETSHQLVLEIYPAFHPQQVEIAGQPVPLRSDATTALAYAFNEESLWRLGKAQFFSARPLIKTGLYPIEPYQPGRIPVVFVHGTFASPLGWARTWNTLRADPQVRERFQFWCSVYSSGNPLSDSANRLREAIEEKVRELDPQGKDPALQRMVVIGHSQGGLLTKLLVTETGDALWRTVSDRPIEELDCSAKVKDTLRRHFIYHPLTNVSRVVFVSTPHRGSYRASSLAQRLARNLVSAPKTLVTAPQEWLALRPQLNLPKEVKSAVPTSIDGMSPKNPWLLALAELPPARNVRVHSIVAVKPGQPVATGNDGVVAYQSASVPYANSEYLTRAVHSCQGKPDVIEELRRILLIHLEESPNFTRHDSLPN